MSFAALLLLLLALPASKLAFAFNLQPSQWPPRGIKLKNVPQFILFSHDDDVNRESSDLVLGLSAAARNPNGCRLGVTWFACTGSCDFDCDATVKLWKRGHEIAAHTVHHPDLRQLSSQKIWDEISGSVDAIAACGVPRQEVQGFRTPFLSDKPEVRQALADLGFRYDSTIGAESGATRVWPGTMINGVGFDCGVGGQKCSRDESYPGMWEVPLYETPDHNLMDYCTDEDSGEPRDNCSPFKQLAYNFAGAYNGNRGPVSVGVHTPYLKKKDYADQLGNFFQFALSQKDVWAITISQFLDWMENPVPASKMRQFMAKYKCIQ